MTKKIIAISLVASSLLASDVKLENIKVVSSANTIQDIKEVTSNITVITANEIELGHYQSIDEILNEVAGVSFSRNGGIGQTTSLFLRGMSSKYTVVLIDGVKVNDPTGLVGANFSNLDINNIQRVEILKGAQGSIWGSDATAGVINIITKEAKNGFHYGAKVLGGSYNTINSSANISYKNDSFNAILNTTQNKSDSFSSTVTNIEELNTYEADEYISSSYQVKLGYELNSKNKIDFNHKDTNNTTSYDGLDASYKNNPDDKESSSNIHEVIQKVNIQHIDNFNILNIYTNNTTIHRKFGDKITSYEYDGSLQESGVNSKIPYIDNSFLLLGVDTKKYSHDNKLKKSSLSNSYFILNNNILNNGNTILNESYRKEDNSIFGINESYKIGAKQFIDKLYFSANISTGYKAPTLYQLYAPATAWGAVGNSELTPEDTKSYDLSIGDDNFTITLFKNEIQNMIVYTTGYNNIKGLSTFKGYEVSYKKDYKQLNTKVDINSTFTNATDKDDKKLARVVEEQLHIGLTYYGFNNLNIKVSSDYIGERYDKADSKGEMTGDYILTNFTINYKATKNITIFAKANNITDEIYQVVDGYGTERRSYYAGLNASF